MKTLDIIKTKTAYTDGGEKLILRYGIFESDGQYGIEIRLDRNSGCEIASFKNVTCSQEQALSIQNTLAEGLVTPVCLREILEELLS